MGTLYPTLIPDSHVGEALLPQAPCWAQSLTSAPQLRNGEAGPIFSELSTGVD